MLSDFYVRCAVVVICTTLIASTYGNPFIDDGAGMDEGEDYEETLENYLQGQQQDKRSQGSTIYLPMRRACIRRGGNCDNRPTDCCNSATCLCNLFGSNCKCQRVRKWGK